MSFLQKTIRYILNPHAATALLSTASGPQPPEGDVDATPQGRLDGGLRLRHFLHNPALLLGVVLVTGLVLVVFFGPLWVSHDPFITSQSILPHYDSETGEFIRLPLAPSAEYPLGTDTYGNDMLSLIVYGARVTLIAGAYITLARLLLGTLLGSLAGWRPGGWLDRAIVNAVGVVASIPLLLSGMILIYALDIRKGAIVFVAALALVGWTETAQVVRGEILVLRNLPYIEGARALGLSDLQIVVRHILPNLLPQLLILSFLEMGAVLILMAELGFLDVYIGGGALFSLDPAFGGTERLVTVPEWGALVARGAPSLRANAHLVLGPALAFFVAIVGMNALGEGLRRILQRATVNTALILKRRTLLVAGAFLLLSRLALQLTGPDYSFKRVAAEFDANGAQAQVAGISAAQGKPRRYPGLDYEVDGVAAYIREQFDANDVLPGWKPEGGINQSYFYTVPGTVSGEDDPKVKGVFGFVPGFDARLSQQLVVLLASLGPEEEGPGESSGVALMLETARLWQENNVDPRRSLLLVVWRGDMSEAQALLSDPAMFTFLPAPTRELPQPELLVRLDDVGSGGDVLLLHGASDENLLRLFASAARSSDVKTETTSYEAPPPSMPGIPAIALRWAGADDSLALQPDHLQRAGQLLNLALLRIARLPDYAS